MDGAGHVGERVFVAGFLGDLRVELFDFGAVSGVVDVAAGIVGIAGEALEFAFGEAVADSQAVDGDVVEKQGLQRVLIGEAIELRAVYAVGNDEDDFAAGQAAVVEQFGGGVDGVVEGFAGAGAEVCGRYRLYRASATIEIAA